MSEPPKHRDTPPLQNRKAQNSPHKAARRRPDVAQAARPPETIRQNQMPFFKKERSPAKQAGLLSFCIAPKATR